MINLHPLSTHPTTTINPPSYHHQPTVIKHQHQPPSSSTIISHHHPKTHWSNKELKRSKPQNPLIKQKIQNWSNKKLKMIKTPTITDQTKLQRRSMVAWWELWRRASASELRWRSAVARREWACFGDQWHGLLPWRLVVACFLVHQWRLALEISEWQWGTRDKKRGRWDREALERKRESEVKETKKITKILNAKLQ